MRNADPTTVRRERYAVWSRRVTKRVPLPTYAGSVGDVWGELQRPTPRRVALDLGVALLFLLVTGLVALRMGPSAVAATVLLAAALAVRRLSWQVMSALAVAAALVQVVAGQVAYLSDAAYPVLFATLGAHHRAAVRRWGLSCAAVATLVGGVFGAVHPGTAARSGLATVAAAGGLAALTAVFTAGGWVAGYLRWQNRRAVQARVDAQLDAAERRRLSELYDLEQERRRVATDMHDVIAHSWAVVAAQSDGARYALRQDPAAAERALEVVGETARAAMADLRTIVAQLRDPGVAPSTPSPEQQDALLERMRASGMDLQVHQAGTPDDSPLVALTAHRLLAESLTNALKHGEPGGPVHVEQDWRDGYRLTVTNPVRAASPDGPEPGGHGLVGMAERAAIAGGTVTAGREGDAWVVRAHIPRPDPGRGAAGTGR